MDPFPMVCQKLSSFMYYMTYRTLVYMGLVRPTMGVGQMAKNSRFLLKLLQQVTLFM